MWWWLRPGPGRRRHPRVCSARACSSCRALGGPRRRRTRRSGRDTRADTSARRTRPAPGSRREVLRAPAISQNRELSAVAASLTLPQPPRAALRAGRSWATTCKRRSSARPVRSAGCTGRLDVGPVFRATPSGARAFQSVRPRRPVDVRHGTVLTRALGWPTGRTCPRRRRLITLARQKLRSRRGCWLFRREGRSYMPRRGWNVKMVPRRGAEGLLQFRAGELRHGPSRSLDEQAGADAEGLLSEPDSPHVEVLVAGGPAARPRPQVSRAPAGLLCLHEMDQIALYRTAGGVLQVDLVLPLQLRVEGVGEDVALGVDHEHLRVAIDEGPLRIADERQRGPPVTLDALGRHVDQLDHEAAIRHEVVQAAAHDVALARRALHPAQERRFPGRRAAARTGALVEYPGTIPAAGEPLDAPPTEGAPLGAADRAQVLSHARRVVAVEEDPVRGGVDDEHVRVPVLPLAPFAAELAEGRVALRLQLGGRPIDEGDQLLGGGRPCRRLGRGVRGPEPVAAEEQRERDERAPGSRPG